MSSTSFSSLRQSVNPSKESFERSASSLAPSTKSYKRSFVIETNYWPVTKWEALKPRLIIYSSTQDELNTVDYNNKNYVRSLTNKNKGFHRQIPHDDPSYAVQYNNKDFIRSFVNNHLGLHRKGEQIPRKNAPDNDDLSNADGWEFDYGPEFYQAEEDVPYITEGKRVVRGTFRYRGTKRNPQDMDGVEEEEVDEIDNYNREEFKYGTAFFQKDSPFHVEEVPQDNRVSMGGFRFIDVKRSVLDSESIVDFSNPAERQQRVQDVDLRYKDTLRSEFDLNGESTRSLDATPKGTPFKQTNLKFTYTLGSPETEAVEDLREQRYRTEVKLTPGQGKQTVYRSGASPLPTFPVNRHPSIRKIFQPSSQSRMKVFPVQSQKIDLGDEEAFESAHQAWKTVKIREENVSSRGKTSSDSDERFHSAKNAWKKLMKEHSLEIERMEAIRKSKRKATDRPDYLTSERTTPDIQPSKFERVVDQRLSPYYKESPVVMSAYEYSPEIERVEVIRKTKRKAPERPEYLTSERIIEDEYDSELDNDRNSWTKKQRTVKRTTPDIQPSRYDRVVEQRRSPYYKELPIVMTHEIVLEPKKEKDRTRAVYRQTNITEDLPDIRLQEYSKRPRERTAETRDGTEYRQERIYQDIPEIRTQKIKKDEPGPSSGYHPKKKRRRPKVFKEKPRVSPQVDEVGQDALDNLDEDLLMAHRNHPNDTGQSMTNIFEKFVGEDGSEIWIKTKEKFTELRHVQDKS